MAQTPNHWYIRTSLFYLTYEKFFIVFFCAQSKKTLDVQMMTVVTIIFIDNHDLKLGISIEVKILVSLLYIHLF